MKGLAVALAFLVLTGCSGSRSFFSGSEARMKSIGTDLGEETAKDRPTYLYSVEGEYVRRGKCQNGRPVIPENCQLGRLRTSFALFKSYLAEARSSEIRRLHALLEEDEKQLTAVDAELAKKEDHDLREQRGIVARELERYRGKLDLLSEQNLEDTLTRLRNRPVVYLVRRDTPLYESNRPFVALFDRAFHRAIVATPNRLVSPGGFHVCALDRDGVKCWGKNDSRQTDVPTLSHPLQVAAGNEHTCALDENGVTCWGLDSSHQTDVPDLREPWQIASGGYHSCAIDQDGVKCWGKNTYGQTSVPSLRHPRQLAAGGEFTCALGDDKVTCWGNVLVTNVPPLTHPMQVAAGWRHACALDDNGVKCWGDNTFHQAAVPVLKNPVQVSTHLGTHICALDDDGVKCWGTEGEAVKVPQLTSPYTVFAGNEISFALDEDGIKHWGTGWEPAEANVPPLHF